MVSTYGNFVGTDRSSTLDLGNGGAGISIGPGSDNVIGGTAPGEGNGIFLTNFPAARGWMSYEALQEKRTDLIMVNLLGNADGSSAVDYTVNCAVGFPYVTGPTPSSKLRITRRSALRSTARSTML